jgi:hypothetical protein
MYELSRNDYKEILNFYGVTYDNKLPTTYLKKMCESILVKKLCSCIKKVPNKNQPESRAIGICNYSVVQKKQLKIKRFTCKKRSKLLNNIDENINTDKIKKTIRGTLKLKSKS